MWRRGLMLLSTLALSGEAFAAPHSWQATLHNPLGVPRPDSVVEIDGRAIDLSGSPGWMARIEGRPVPTQFVDRDGDGRPDALALLVDLGARQRLRVRLDPVAASEAASRVQAMIGVRRDASFDGKKWIGGRLEDVERLDLDPAHMAGDRLTLFDGPGWESDRVGFRIYLDQRNALDLFGKKRPEPVLQWIGRGVGDYHKEADWGMDILHVTDSLGAGGLGVIEAGRIRQVGAAAGGLGARRIGNGPVFAGVSIDNRGLTADAIRYDLSARYTIAAGSRATEVVAKASHAAAPIVAGIEKRPSVTVLRSHGRTWAYVATFGRQSFIGDELGMAILYRLEDISEVGDDGHTLFVRFKDPGQIRYLVAAAWVKDGGGISNQEEFKAYLKGLIENQDGPVRVSLKRVRWK